MIELRTRYQIMKDAARIQTVEQIATVPEIVERLGNPYRLDLRPIDDDALMQMDQWEVSHLHRHWHDVPRRQRGHIKAFDVSLWYEETLCGLCFATPKRSKLRIKLMLLEANPDPSHPLKGLVAAFMILAVENYAKLIDIPEILIPEPLSGAIPLYLRLGFRYNDQGLLVRSTELALA